MAQSDIKKITGPVTDNVQKFHLIKKFLGYRSREDKTMLPYGTLVWPSQNVLIDITGRLKNREGYTLDGQVNATATPIYAWFDWDEHKNSAIRLRAYSGNLQFRYVDSTATVIWTTIMTGLGTTHIRFTNYWHTAELENVVLFVDGSTNVYRWNGATTTFASATANTITKEGTDTWALSGFYTAANKKVWLGGIEYTYTGGESTTTLTGVTPDPTAGGHVAGDLIYQSVVTLAAVTTVATGYKFDGIACLDNQVYYGSASSNNVYASAVNNYTTAAFATPRVVGEGALFTLRGLWTAFVVQESYMYMSAGTSQWYQTKKQLSSDNAKESFTVLALKTSPRQAPLSQEVVSHDRNSVIQLTHETRLTTLGRTLNIFDTPMMTDYSYPVAKDFNQYDFTNASLFYWKSYVFVTLPVEGKWLMLNQTDPQNVFWEAPQTGQFSGFANIDGDIYAHGYNVPETYKLFDGGSDNGAPILSKAKLAFTDFGTPELSKFFNEFFMNGYITANTPLAVSWVYGLDGCAQTLSGILDGSNTQVVCIRPDEASLGKTPLGKHPLGSALSSGDPDPLPPYFNAILVAPRVDFYQVSFEFQTYLVDANWQLILLGPLVTHSPYGNNAIKISLA